MARPRDIEATKRFEEYPVAPAATMKGTTGIGGGRIEAIMMAQKRHSLKKSASFLCQPRMILRARRSSP